jgi:hypothetical protein
MRDDEREKRHRRKRSVARLPVGKDKTSTDDGVDVTLIRWMLSLTPSQRLMVLEKTIEERLTFRECMMQSQDPQQFKERE